MMKKTWLLTVMLMGVACESSSPTTAPSDGPSASTPEGVSKAGAPKLSLDLATLAAEAIQVALVPSPAEMQKALSNAGLATKLASMVEHRDISMDVANKDQIAVRTGVVLADLVLTVKSAENKDQIARLNRLKEGFAALGAGDDVARTIDELSNKIKSGSGSRDDLLKEFDELSGVLVPELKYEAGDWVVPLIQAGSWLEGAHLVAAAVKKESKFDAAGQLLRQPAVVDYFLKYLKREGRNKAPDKVVAKLEQTLMTLKEVTAKSTLTEDDVSTIHSATGAVLTLL
jgi:hypothetical protein